MPEHQLSCSYASLRESYGRSNMVDRWQAHGSILPILSRLKRRWTNFDKAASPNFGYPFICFVWTIKLMDMCNMHWIFNLIYLHVIVYRGYKISLLQYSYESYMFRLRYYITVYQSVPILLLFNVDKVVPSCVTQKKSPEVYSSGNSNTNRCTDEVVPYRKVVFFVDMILFVIIHYTRKGNEGNQKMTAIETQIP